MLVMRRLLISFVVAFALTAWICPVSAQTGQFSTFDGFEITPGNVEGDGMYGWVCYGRTTGALNGSLTLTMDYVGMPTPGGRNTIKRGTWTLPVYSKTMRGDTYMGALYGNIAAGEIHWDSFGKGALSLRLTITGGTQMLQGVSGHGMFYSSTNYDGKGRMTGELIFYF